MPSETSYARQRMERAMVDTCRITRGQGEPSYDPDTGNLIPGTPVTVYEGRAMVGAPITTVVQTGERGGEQEYVTRLPVSIPIDAAPVAVGDHVRMLTSTFDPQLAGKTMRVHEIVVGTRLARRRLLCELTAIGPLV